VQNKPAYPIASVDNALRLAIALRDGNALRLVDAAELLGVARATAHRLLSMLEHHGFAVQNRDDRTYEAGPVLRDGAGAGDDIVDVRRAARPHMEWIVDTIGETVHLVTLEGTGVRFVDGIDGTHGLRVGTRIGFVLPAHATSGGKALLATLDDDEVRRRFAGPVAVATSRTITDVEVLLRVLDRVRRRGYATNVEESEPGVAAVGAAISAPSGAAAAALAIAGPVGRFSRQRLPQYVEVLREACQEVTATLRGAGGR
jgi:DNA-binding IclR family transcriptional regulator